MNKTALVSFIDNALVLVWGIFFIVLPFIMSTALTDAFLLPKQAVFIGLVLLSLLLWGIKIVVSEKVTIQRTPFDVPVLLFLFALMLSSLFAVNRIDSLLATIPLIVAALSFFILGNALKKPNTIIYILSALLIGGSLTALLAVFSYLKVYPILFAFTHAQSFTPLGSLLEQAFYFAFLLPIAISFALPLVKGSTNNKTVTGAATSVLLVAGLGVTLLQLFTTQKPVLLPFETGFQTAFAAISQDTGRIAQGFLLGSGFGNFAAVFTRFKQASFNANPLWATPFANSSSFLLELLATTGILGLLSFLFLLFRIVTKPSAKKANPVYFGLVVFAAIGLIFPYSFFEIALAFALLGLFSAAQALKDHKQYYDVELKFVALKKGVISLQQVSIPSHEKHEYNRPTAIVVGGVFLVVIVLVGWFAGKFILSDIIFQQSLVLAAGNNGTATYKDQAQAITTFPYRSAYYRIFSQTNIALAGSLANAQPHGQKPNTQTQNTLYALIQQGISTGKQATVISPQTVSGWQNLSSIYRSLIGVGQNADSFAIIAAQQSVALDPTNPQEFVALGGIYYQLGQWDNAIRSFQQAIALKQDYANAYYNLGHAYEQKQDYQDALSAYQAVKTLVAQDKANETTIDNDIAALQQKMGQQTTQTPAQQQTAAPRLTPNPTQAPSQPLNLSGESNTSAKSNTLPQPTPAQ